MNSDAAIVKKYILSGEAEDFRAIYEKYFRRVYAFCLSKSNDSELAKDTTQEVFITLIDIIGKYNFQSHFSSFVFGIAQRKLYEQLRKRGKAISLDRDIESDFAVADNESIDLSMQINNIKQLMRDLSPDQQQVIQLRYLQNMNLADTARQLNLSVNNIKVIQHRAIKRLNKLLMNNQ